MHHSVNWFILTSFLHSYRFIYASSLLLPSGGSPSSYSFAHPHQGQNSSVSQILPTTDYPVPTHSKQNIIMQLLYTVYILCATEQSAFENGFSISLPILWTSRLRRPKP